MVIYADILFCFNALADYCLLTVTARLCGITPRRIRVAAAAGVGALFSLLLLLPPLPTAAVTVLQGLCALLCCGAAFGIRPLRRLLKCTAVLYLSSTALAGLMLALSQHSDRFAFANGSFYVDISPFLLLGATLLFYLLQGTLQFFLQDPADAYLGQLSLLANGKTLCCGCLCDSGNTLTEPLSGCRVVLLKMSLAPQLLSDVQLSAASEVLQGRSPDTAAGIRLLPCATVAGEKLLPCFLLAEGSELTRCKHKYRLPRCAVAVCPDEALGTQDAIAFIP